jgi:hypothetical protein
MLAGSFFLYRSTSAFVHDATKADGEVVAMHTSYSRSKNGGTSRTYSPVVLFHTPTHKAVQFTSDFSTSPPSHHVGQKVTVLYRANDPHDVKLSDFWSLWFGTVLLGGMGTIFTAIGAGLTFHRSTPVAIPPGNLVPNSYTGHQQPPSYTRL